MEIIQSIILGLIQGITEFLPISSSGHLILMPHIFGWKDQGLAFDVALHWGTLFAVLAYFYKDWINIIKNSYFLEKKNLKNRNLESLKSDHLFIIVMTTIPGVITGLLLNNYAETIFRNPLLIAATLSIGAIFLFYADKMGTKKSDLTNLTLKTGILIGLFQAIAIIPGISRSGITITAALLLGMKRTDSARFSFLLSTPIILGAGVKEFPILFTGGFDANIIVGTITAAISGYLAIKYMLKYLANRDYNIFVGYRIILALIIIALFY